MKTKIFTANTFTIFPVLLLTFLASTSVCRAATYYISQASGNDSAAGTSPASAWATIGKANNTLSAGDTVFVAGGTYNEAIAPGRSGSAGSPITYAGDSENMPVIRQAMLLNDDYIRVIGFEITHNSTVFNHGITLYSTDHCEILNNNIHHTYGQAIRNNSYYGGSNYNIIRGNTMSYIGCPTGVVGSCTGANAINLLGNYNLIEYNEIFHTLDFVDTNGGYNIIRNNYLHDYRNTDFPDGSGDAAHVDTWQPFGVVGDLSDRNIFEYNWAADNLEANSHLNQVRDENGSGEKEFIIRGNVGTRFGSYIAQFGGIDYVRLYNNTYADFFHIYPDSQKGWSALAFNPENTDNESLNNFVFNNIFYRTNRPSATRIIGFVGASQALVQNNACEQSGSDPGCSVITGINFSNYGADVFYPSASSACRGAGKAMAQVNSATGSGTSFTVDDAGFFTDGFGIVGGDKIAIGASGPVTITSINYNTNTITLGSSVSWNTGDPVRLAYQSAAPDIGAYEYQGDYSYDIGLMQPQSLGGGIIRLAANVTNPDNIRSVNFSINGVPVGDDETAPYGINWEGAEEGRSYHITVRAYSRFAAKDISKSSTLTYVHGPAVPDETPPAQPAGLTVR